MPLSILLPAAVSGGGGGGSQWFDGSGAPSGALGNVGDFYLDVSNGDVYEKTGSSTWTLDGNIKGPTGATGPTGPAGADGSKWFDGSGAPAGALGSVGDFYLDVSNGDVYEKTGASTWTLDGNIKGPTGAQGPTGPEGPAGPAGTIIVTFFASNDSGAGSGVWSNQPAARTAFMGVTNNAATLVDVTGCTEFRFIVAVTTAGVTGADLILEGDNGTPTDFDSVAIDATGIISGGWTAIPSGYDTEITLRVFGVDGNGTADPRFGVINAHFRP